MPQVLFARIKVACMRSEHSRFLHVSTIMFLSFHAEPVAPTRMLRWRKASLRSNDVEEQCGPHHSRTPVILHRL